MHDLQTIIRLNEEAVRRSRDITTWSDNDLIVHARTFVRDNKVQNTEQGLAFVKGYLVGKGASQTVAHNIAEEALRAS